MLENSSELAQEPSSVQANKVAACGISLGVAILKLMVGDSIAAVNSNSDLEELMAAAIMAELKL